MAIKTSIIIAMLIIKATNNDTLTYVPATIIQESPNTHIYLKIIAALETSFPNISYDILFITQPILKKSKIPIKIKFKNERTTL